MIATAIYWNVVLARFHGCLSRLPESTLLSTTPYPTPGRDSCMITLAAPAAKAQKSIASAAVTGSVSHRAVRLPMVMRQSAAVM